MKFSDSLQSARLARHITADDAALVFSVSLRTLQGWEQGRLDSKTHLHAPLLEFFQRHAPRKRAPKSPHAGRPPRLA